MATPGGVRLVLTASAENTQRIMVLHFLTAPGTVWTQPQLLALATAWWAQVNASLKAAVATNTNFLSVTATDMSNDVLPVQAVYNIPQPAPGLLAGDPLPANTACCISWKTPYANRKLRGRTFLWGCTEAQCSGSVFSNAYVAAVGNFAQSHINFSGAGGPIVTASIYSRAANVLTPITTFLIDTLVDSQRRRLPNRGS